MSVNPFPQSWDDCGMNWNDPDPLNITYHYAIQAAINERQMAAWRSTFHGSSPFTQFGDDMVPCADLFEAYTYRMRELWSMVYLREDFMNCTSTFNDSADKPPRMDEWNCIASIRTVTPGSTIYEMKECMIQLKHYLDRMTLFDTLVNCGKQSRYGSASLNYMQEREWSEEEREKYVRETAVQEYYDYINEPEYNRNTIDRFENSTYLTARFSASVSKYYEYEGAARYNFSASASMNDGGVQLIQVRSFARPKLLCLVKPGINSSSDGVFYDFGTGFRQNVNTVLDYGQIPENNAIMKIPVRIEPEKALLDPNIPYNQAHTLRLRVYPALDYAVEGGFKFY